MQKDLHSNTIWIDRIFYKHICGRKISSLKPLRVASNLFLLKTNPLRKFHVFRMRSLNFVIAFIFDWCFSPNILVGNNKNSFCNILWGYIGNIGVGWCFLGTRNNELVRSHSLVRILLASGKFHLEQCYRVHRGPRDIHGCLGLPIRGLLSICTSFINQVNHLGNNKLL